MKRTSEPCPRICSAFAIAEAPLGELINQLGEGRLDLAIVNPFEGVPKSFHAHPLYSEKYVAVLPPDHPLGARNSVALRDLSGQPYVDRLSCEMREMFTALCSDCGVELYARFRSEREDWVQAMVLARIGIAVMPEIFGHRARARPAPHRRPGNRAHNRLAQRPRPSVQPFDRGDGALGPGVQMAGVGWPIPPSALGSRGGSEAR